MPALDDARRFCAVLKADTEGKPGHWRMIKPMAVRARIRDQKAIDAAVSLAVKNQWLEVEGGHSVRLTEEGRRV